MVLVHHSYLPNCTPSTQPQESGTGIGHRRNKPGVENTNFVGRCVIIRPAGFYPGLTPRSLLSVNVGSPHSPPWCIGRVSFRGSIDWSHLLLQILRAILWYVRLLLSLSFFVPAFLLFLLLARHLLFIPGLERYFLLVHLSCCSILDATSGAVLAG